MKTRIIKSILTLMLMFVALPMMSQDYMIIHFKDGDLRKFYMKNVTEIKTSKFDANGVQHGDYDYQHITTIYDKYVYNLEDVESISFTKIDEELAKENFVSAMPAIFPIIDDCESISDVESKIDLLKNIEGVEDARSDGHRLYVTIAEDETYSFFFNHNNDDDDSSFDETIAQIKAMMPAIKKAIDKDGKKISAVIANQQDKDKKFSNIKKKYLELKDCFKKCGIDVKYENNLTVDFFCHNSSDPEQRNIYDYDIIFLITHGGYGPFNFWRNEYEYDEEGNLNKKFYTSTEKIHDILLSDDIAFFNDFYKSIWVKNYDVFKEWRDNSQYKDINDGYINYSFCKEKRPEGEYWVAHPILTEWFFEDIADGKFHDNSILFNTSCQSLKGEDDNPSFSFADILVNKKNLRVYLGYDETDNAGPGAGCDLYYKMLFGNSLKKAYDNLTDNQRHNKVKEDGKDIVANLLIYPQNNPEVEQSFLSSPYTEPIDQETVMNNYNTINAVEVIGWTTSLDYKYIIGGFEYDTDDSFTSCRKASNVEPYQLSESTQKGNVRFRAKLTDLEPGKTYYYRAFTNDGMFYNYGEPRSFTIYIAPVLSENSISLQLGNTGNIRISSGSGEYEAMSSNPEVATATVNKLKEDHAILLIQTLKAGTTTITVTDTQSGLTATIAVTVTGSTPTPTDVPAEPIDLGLPSGTKWASYNVGATKPEEYGGYYAWGETEENGYYDWSYYKYYQNGSYVSLGSDISGTEYDVAHVKWGGNWVIPTQEQQQELLDNCTNEWTTLNGVNGRKFTSKINGNSIFLPAAGYRVKVNYTTTLRGCGEGGLYWSSVQDSLDMSRAYHIDFYSGRANSNWGYYVRGLRYNGFSVRPVIHSTPTLVDLTLSSTEPITVKVDDKATIEITSGNGSYTAESDNEDVAIARVYDNASVIIKGVSVGTATITVTDTKSGQTATVAVTVTGTINPDVSPAEPIDLGLPSGTKWASWNVGATKPEEYGGYYAWGETEEKDYYDWSTYIHCNGTAATCHDIGSDISGTQYDVAHVKWGGNWRMPTHDEQMELLNNCTSEWTTLNGVNGSKFTSKINGNSIFLPAAGLREDGDLYYAGEDGYYWSSTQSPYYSSSAYGLGFFSVTAYWDGGDGRCAARSVRPVVRN